MPRNVIPYVTLAVALCCAAPALAQPAPATPARVVLAPLATLGARSRSKQVRATRRLIERGLAAVPRTKVVPARTMSRAIRKARKPKLKTCDGEAPCLTELGALLGATHVVSAELGGLGAARVVYLKVVDMKTHKELRSTTLELGGKRDAKADARAAAYRLLAPEQYKGTLDVNVDVKKAEIFVDGRRVGTSPSKPLTLTVGTHALRITHPEFRDFVRFVDVEFSRTGRVEVKLQQFPIVSRNVKAHDAKLGPVTPSGDTIVYRGMTPTPWYKRWYSVAGASAVVFIGSAVVFGLAADGISSDRVKTIGDGK